MSNKLLLKLRSLRRRDILLGLAGLGIVAQLAALALLAQDQMREANKRQAVLAEERSSARACFENTSGPRRAACLLQARSARSPGSIAPSEAVLPNANFLPQFTDGATARATGEVVVPSARGGVVSASFAR